MEYIAQVAEKVKFAQEICINRYDEAAHVHGQLHLMLQEICHVVVNHKFLEASLVLNLSKLQF